MERIDCVTLVLTLKSHEQAMQKNNSCESLAADSKKPSIK